MSDESNQNLDTYTQSILNMTHCLRAYNNTAYSWVGAAESLHNSLSHEIRIAHLRTNMNIGCEEQIAEVKKFIAHFEQIEDSGGEGYLSELKEVTELAYLQFLEQKLPDNTSAEDHKKTAQQFETALAEIYNTANLLPAYIAVNKKLVSAFTQCQENPEGRHSVSKPDALLNALMDSTGTPYFKSTSAPFLQNKI
tara:strand:- start:83079 stop:83663 length:585 start_codon:yes stop_codon:yes gene_type:complete